MEILSNVILLPESIYEKMAIIDLSAVFDNGTKLHIEIQVNNLYNYSKRSFYYFSKLYTEGLKKGEDYINLEKVVQINILDYNLIQGANFHSIYTLKNQNNINDIYKNILEIHYLELRKLEELLGDDFLENEKLKQWLRFIAAESDEEIEAISKENEDIKTAVEKLKELSADDDVRAEAEVRKKAILDYINQLSGARREGLEIGMKQGIEQGIEQGREEGFVQGLRLSNLHLIETLYPNEDMKTIIDQLNEITEVSLLVAVQTWIVKGNYEELKEYLNSIQ